jgi:acetolactate synthase-1/2/3 large subunit
MAKTAFDKEITGSDALVQVLRNLNVKVIFAITGAGNLAIIDSLVRDGEIDIVYSHHEQASVMAAQGYARVSGELGVALVTTGGGTSNAATGILSAYMDSIPIMLISGNESSYHCESPLKLRAYGVQGFDSTRLLEGICKRSIRVQTANQIPFEVKYSARIALHDRKGPVHIDIPMDLQRQKIDNFSEEELPELLEPRLETTRDLEIKISQLVSDFCNSYSPLIYIGNGCRDKETMKILSEMITSTSIPFILSWSAIDMFPESHPQNVGRVGIYGDRAANILLQRSDLLIAIGTRLAIPQVGYDRSDFARLAKKWVVDIDSTECGKFEGLGWEICNVSALNFVKELSLQIRERTYKDKENWLATIEKTKNLLPRLEQALVKDIECHKTVHSVEVIDVIARKKKKDAVVVTDVGAGLLSGHYIFSASGSDRLITSQGLGEMGFGLPASIGAFFADKSRQIICLNTDGGIMFNLQELQVVGEHSIPIKLFIFNNKGYGMIKFSQSNLFNNRLSGSTIKSGISFPDFESVAKTFGMSYLKIDSLEQLNENIDLINHNSSAILVDVIMSPDQRYLPKLGTSKTELGTLVSPPIEDLEPLIEIDMLQDLLGYRPKKESFKARSLED